MHFVSDLHLHSRFSRAVSPQMTLPVMAQFAREKGIDILSASDFTHPVWFKEIREQLEESNEGLYKLQEPFDSAQGKKDVFFLLSTEISSIYKQGNKLRRIHNLVFVPNFAAAERLNQELIRRGCNLTADGRPIIGLSSKNLLELLLAIDERSMLIPCHVWTPHFGVYGSKSGFETLEECFEDLAPYVYGIETGISSDPEMNWRVKELANRSILSFSDAHSPANMGREATVFELGEPTYENIRQAIMRRWEVGGGKVDIEVGSSKSSFQTQSEATPASHIQPRISYTVEFYPEEGKYHFSGHRSCQISFSPDEVIQKGTMCPVCRREFTEGVALRIEQLAGRNFAKEYEVKESEGGISWHTDKNKHNPSYVKLVRLEQIIGAALGIGDKSVKVKSMYEKMLAAFGSELEILLRTPLTDIEKIVGDRAADGVGRVRAGKITIDAGYDGAYGKVKIFEGVSGVPGVSKVSDAQLRLDI